VNAVYMNLFRVTNQKLAYRSDEDAFFYSEVMHKVDPKNVLYEYSYACFSVSQYNTIRRVITLKEWDFSPSLTMTVVFSDVA